MTEFEKGEPDFPNMGNVNPDQKHGHGVTLPKSMFRSIDRAIKREYGKNLQEIADTEPVFAFQALKFGMRSYFTRRYNKLIHVGEAPDKTQTTKAVVDREMDGDAAFEGVTGNSMDGLVDTLLVRHEHTEADFVIRTVGNRSLMDIVRRRQAEPELAVVIAHSEPLDQ